MVRSSDHQTGRRRIVSSRGYSRHRGIALIWTAIIFLLIVLIIGLMIDSGKVCLVLHQLHNAADAGALAGAQTVKHPDSTARQDAIDAAHLNFADNEAVVVLDNPTNDPDGDVVLGRWIWQTRTFIPTTDGPTAVKVVARRTAAHQQLDGQGGRVPLIFGPIANVLDVDLTRYAIARSSGSIGAGIIALAENPDWSHAPTGLWVHGTGLIDVQGGDIQVNAVQAGGASPWQAMRMNGSLTINASEFNIVGSTNPDPEDPAAWETFWDDPTLPASVNPYDDRVDDPLLDLNPPFIPGGVATHSSGHQFVDPVTEDTIGLLGETSLTNSDLKVLQLYPGYYPGGINLSSGSWTSDEVIGYTPNPDPNLPDIPIYKVYDVELRLNRGGSVEDSLYALGGSTDGQSGLIIKGNANLYGEFVTLYVTGAHNGYDNVKYGVLDIGGNGYVEVSPPGDFFLGADGMPQIDGQPGISFWQDFNNTNPARIIGTGDFNLEGTLYFPNNHTEVGGTSFQAGNQLLAGSLDLHGTGVLGIAYDGRNFIESFRSYLVW
ncbi:MAG: pilus assembly protein TadG-related protein [Planctomycetota bacterium]|jgi:hypothetical protein